MHEHALHQNMNMCATFAYITCVLRYNASLSLKARRTVPACQSASSAAGLNSAQLRSHGHAHLMQASHNSRERSSAGQRMRLRCWRWTTCPAWSGSNITSPHACV